MLYDFKDILRMKRSVYFACYPSYSINRINEIIISGNRVLFKNQLNAKFKYRYFNGLAEWNADNSWEKII